MERTTKALPPRPATTDLAPDDLLTREEVAGYLRMRPRTVREWTDAGDLPALKLGGRVRYRWADVQAFAASHSR